MEQSPLKTSEKLHPLHEAASQGNAESVAQLLKDRRLVPDVKIQSRDGRTALHYAVMGNNPKVIEMLLKGGLDKHAKNEDGQTALHQAAAQGQDKMVKLLVEYKSDVNSQDKAGRTPLHQAASQGQSSVTKQLLEARAKPELKTLEGQTPLHVAAAQGHLESVKWLVEKKVDVNAQDHNQQTSLYLAASNGQLPVVEYLLTQRTEVNARTQAGQTALHGAAAGGHLRVVQQLLTAKAEVNAADAEQSTALHEAAKAGYRDVVACLMKSGASIQAVNKKQHSALEFAAEQGHSETVALLLAEMKSSPQEQECRQAALCSAAKQGRRDIVEQLLADKAEINLPSAQQQQTALHAAVRAGQTDLVEWLLEQKAAPNALDAKQRTPLMIAAAEGVQTSTVEMLIQAKADVDFTNQHGENALWLAARNDQLDTLKTLLKWKATLPPDDKLQTLPDNDSKRYLQEIALGRKSSEMVGMLNKQGYLTISMQIKYEDLTLDKQVGKGSYGTVWLGSHKFNPVAIKKLNMENLPDKEVETFRQEASVMASVSLFSNHLVRLQGICLEKPNYCMIMEFMPNGDLYKLLQNKEAELSWTMRYQLAWDISVGLYHLHEKGIWHRDLKSLNVFLDDQQRAKLGDFGMATLKPLVKPMEGQFQGGTVLWSAPEIVANQPYTAEADIFSLGIIFYELATRELPYTEVLKQRGGDVLKERILSLKDNPLTLPPDCPVQFAQLIGACCSADPKARPSIFSIIRQIESLKRQAQELSVAAKFVLGNFGQLMRACYAAVDPQDRPPISTMIRQVETLEHHREHKLAQPFLTQELSEAMKLVLNNVRLGHEVLDVKSRGLSAEVVQQVSVGKPVVDDAPVCGADSGKPATDVPVYDMASGKPMVDDARVTAPASSSSPTFFKQEGASAATNASLKYAIDSGMPLEENPRTLLSPKPSDLSSPSPKPTAETKVSKRKPLNTQAGGDCAFHALFGVWDEKRQQVTCPKVEEKRQQAAKAIGEAKDKSPLRPLIYANIRELILSRSPITSIQIKALQQRHQEFLEEQESAQPEFWQTFAQQLRRYPTVIAWIREKNSTLTLHDDTALRIAFYAVLNREEGTLYGLMLSLPELQTAFEAYNEGYNASFDLERLITPEVIKEYAQLIEQPHNWLLPSEIQLLAQVFGIKVEYYTHPDATECSVFNPSGSTSVGVQFNGRDHFEQLPGSMASDKPLMDAPVCDMKPNKL